MVDSPVDVQSLHVRRKEIETAVQELRLELSIINRQITESRKPSELRLKNLVSRKISRLLADQDTRQQTLNYLGIQQQGG
jgi:hypothetical protein